MSVPVDRNFRVGQSVPSLHRKVIEGYGAFCRCCGEDHIGFLTIEHINHDGKAHLKKCGGAYPMYLDIIKRNYPDEYTVLCMNCNWATRYGKPCPHELEKLLDNESK